ncbi:dipeptide/oligopeptide/nickel ABC transporter permease/ATP-binding protein [Microbacterium mangrovi]|uniref:dipeptide/oligopeptide/nickel ABC transporter permease/ATP-binding protein n=1 Tax=Microbacterium mangrovi TaxID=1348253 RepID=UPI000AB99A15|nr:dipeptide/oligopeptide/nickel ABC transporter permease/ATP-binding protein [Microbacterium mangrovi]
MSATTLTGALDPSRARRAGLFARFLRRPAGVIPFAIFLLIVLVAIFAPLLAPYDPNHVDLAIAQAGPSAAHPLGGDATGRDVLSRLIWGARTTLVGALITVVTAIVLGVPTGIAAGYFGGAFDRITTWISDALQSVPGMIILLVVAAGTRSDFVILMATVGVFMAPGYFRMSRSTTQAVRNELYIDAARVSGLTSGRILSRHVVRSTYAPITIQTALTAGIAMGMQAGLQFLGIGDANTPSWGAMMNEGFHYMLSNPRLLLWPSLALGLSIAVLALMGSTLAELIQVRAPEPRAVRRAKRRAQKSAGRTQDGSGAAAASTAQTPAVGRIDPAFGTGVLRSDPQTAAVRVENLRVSYGDTEVVHGTSLDVAPGEVVGIVGESGSGKSQTVFSILGLLPEGGRADASAVLIGGRDVTGLDARRRQALLGRDIGYIPQEPMSNLDPSYTIGWQLTEPLRKVHGLSRADATQRARQMLTRVGILDPARVMRSYPHQISGGMAQRVLIAGAIAGRPSLLVADEPTTALDVTVQAEVLELLRELQAEDGMALLIVTHNFGVVADICDRVIVMQNGSIIEEGEVHALFAHPADPYTRELIAASLDDAAGRAELDAAWAAGAGAERPEREPDPRPEHDPDPRPEREPDPRPEHDPDPRPEPVEGQTATQEVTR